MYLCLIQSQALYHGGDELALGDQVALGDDLHGGDELSLGDQVALGDDLHGGDELALGNQVALNITRPRQRMLTGWSITSQCWACWGGLK